MTDPFTIRIFVPEGDPEGCPLLTLPSAAFCSLQRPSSPLHSQCKALLRRHRSIHQNGTPSRVRFARRSLSSTRRKPNLSGMAIFRALRLTGY